MLDINLIRNETERVKTALSKRNGNYAADIDAILEIDKSRRELMQKIETMRAEQNSASKQIPQIKKAGGDTSALMEQMKQLSEKIKEGNAQISELEAKQREILLSVPNMPADDVPAGKDDTDNVEVRRWGEPKKFSFEPKAHWDIGEDLGILNSEAAAKVAGARFHFYVGLGARLERSIVSYFLNTHTENGYTEMFPPFMVNRTSMEGTGQYPKFVQSEGAFVLSNNDFYLVPTAEVPVTNYHRDEILKAEQLPIKYCAYSACFRAEAGSAGRDTRGLIRQHQFNKVELVKFCEPEESWDELEKLVLDAERVLQGLGLPYRVVCLSTGDLGFCSAKTYDIEVWMPSYNRYVEISSCSNFVDYQSRRAQIRYKKDVKDKARLVHTLNGSGVAAGRTTAAILENYQNEDGSVTIPEALLAYMGTDAIK
ncbi:MAG: serine--tRNA ligase [Oscillospiraceae bacterium]|jgi:seryl-tRNA synthetase|nr:serine--tRNA ligase [Oscillospiraceae bacterium]